jgi:7-cyano-7-deazaguanine synthase
MSSSPAVLLLSGGMDSATCLWWLRDQLPDVDVHAVSIDYRQRHRVEIDYAAKLAARCGAHSHQTLQLDLSLLGGNPLTDPTVQVPAATDRQQAATVVPFRNLLFVSAAAAYAETHDIADIYIAPVRDDYEAYRDCRREFYDALETTLQLGGSIDRAVHLHTPFVDKWKSEVITLGLQLAVPYELTHTCYAGRRPACGQCDACVERLRAFKANHVDDPLAYDNNGPSREGERVGV